MSCLGGKLPLRPPPPLDETLIWVRVDAEELRATPEKMRAINQTLQPKNVQQLRSFLGLLNYYRKFLPNLATIIQPLNDLLQKGRKWVWSSECTQAMETAKQLLTASNLLTHYDATLPRKLAADASQYGLGVVISHVLPDGVERPVPFASRSLSSNECNYSQIDKEALALVYAVKKFQAYLYGRKFTVVTDHKPLTSIFGSRKGPWLQRDCRDGHCRDGRCCSQHITMISSSDQLLPTDMLTHCHNCRFQKAE